MLRITRMFLLAAVSLFAVLPAHAEEAADAIAKVFRHDTLRADFVQNVYDSNMRIQQTLRGRLALQRPGKFRWSYQSPYEQEIVADGEKVWMYDVDLEQVTVKHQDKTMGGTPALLLSSRDEWRNQFNVSRVKRGDEMDWFKLVPIADGGTFEYLMLGVEKEQLSRLEIKDSFGQLTELQFGNLLLGTEIDPETFVFVLPYEVDVLDETVEQ